MNTQIKRIQKPRCFLLYAVAPEGMPASEANRILNSFIGDPAHFTELEGDVRGDPSFPLPIFHDHFIGQPGGIVIFYVETTEQRDALVSQKRLDGWHVELQPLIFSHSPAAFDEQTAFTLRAYRGLDWEAVQRDKRPAYGNPNREAETAQEE